MNLMCRHHFELCLDQNLAFSSPEKCVQTRVFEYTLTWGAKYNHELVKLGVKWNADEQDEQQDG